MGTPDFAVPTLEALVHAAHEVVCVYTQPPRKAGRGKKLQPTPVHQAAERLGIECAILLRSNRRRRKTPLPRSMSMSAWSPPMA